MGPTTGRNEPCPCGSGKKYKRCCLARDEAAAVDDMKTPVAVATSADPSRGQQTPPKGGGHDESLFPGLRSYVIAQMVEDSAEWEALRVKDPVQWAMRTRAPVAALSMEELQTRLAAWGIDASREAFVALTEGETSAWDVSRKWFEGRAMSSLPRHAEDFAGLAACRLWNEFLADRPSLERVDDWIREGYELEGQGQDGEACKVWRKAWEFIRPRLTPEMRRREDADAAYVGLQCILNWTQDFVLALCNASIRDQAEAERGIDFVRELLDQFPDDTWLTHANTRCDLAELQWHAGRPAEGEATLRALIAEFPDRVVGYCRLAEQFEKTDKRRALEILEEASRHPVRDGRDYDLAARIEDLEKALLEAEAKGEADHPGPSPS